MAFIEKNLTRQAAALTPGVIYTVGADTTAIIKDIHICNNGSSDCHISIWLVPNGASATNENVMFKQWNVPSNDFAHWNGYQILDTAGDTIVASGQFNGQITITMSGAEVT